LLLLLLHDWALLLLLGGKQLVSGFVSGAVLGRC
jgi:hypothetical protein